MVGMDHVETSGGWAELPQPGIAILESRPRIEGWIKRDEIGQQVPTRVLRKARQLEELPRLWTRPLVVVDFSADQPGFLASLGAACGAFRDIRFAVVIPSEERSWEWPLRELGVTHVVMDHSARRPVLEIIRREIGRIPDRMEVALARFAPR